MYHEIMTNVISTHKTRPLQLQEIINSHGDRGEHVEANAERDTIRIFAECSGATLRDLVTHLHIAGFLDD